MNTRPSTGMTSCGSSNSLPRPFRETMHPGALHNRPRAHWRRRIDRRGIPEDILARLNVKKGDVLHVVETADRELRLIPFDPALAAKMDKAEDIMRRYRNTLDALAK